MWTLYVLFAGRLRLDFAQNAFDVAGPVAYLVAPRRRFLQSALPGEVEEFVANFYVISEAGVGNPLETFPHPLPLPLEDVAWWRARCEEVAGCFRDFRMIDLDHAIAARPAMDRLLTAWLQGTTPPGCPAVAGAPAWLRSLVEYVVAHAGDPSLDHLRLVAESGVTASHLNHVFNRHYGTSPLRFLRRERMRLAARLLEARADESIGAVAQACGYLDAALFSRHFCREHGRSPRAYRRESVG